MLYARVNKDTDEVLEFPVTEKELRNALVNTTLPSVITEISLIGTDYVRVPPLTKAEIGLQSTMTHSVAPTGVAKDPETGEWVRQYTLLEVPQEAQLDRIAIRWKYIRERREAVLKDIDWRVLRNQREVALGLTPTDDLSELYTKAQELADLTDTYEDPFLIDESVIKI
jgi:hypothetical protein